MKRCYVVSTGLRTDPNRNIRGVYTELEIAFHEVSHYIELERQAGQVFTQVTELNPKSDKIIAIYCNEDYAIVVEVWYMDQPIQQRC
jgi:hypothetical protein